MLLTFYVFSIKSHVDGTAMDGISSIRMSAGGTDFISGRNLIRWTEVFLMPSKNPERPIQDNDDPARAAGHLARAICMALTPNLAKLKSDELSPLAVRVNLDPDNVSFTIFLLLEFYVKSFLVNLEVLKLPFFQF